MKIGILSMHRVVNYGSFLQAYALKETLKAMGHECLFMDIKPGKKIIETTTPDGKFKKLLFLFKKFDKYFLKRINHYFFLRKRTERFQKEFFSILGLTKEPNYNSDYDGIVIGSDEVFNCTQKASWGFSKTLFGEGLSSDLIITYAASCGFTTLDRIDHYNIREEIKTALTNLKIISVRDKNTYEFAKELTNKKVVEHLDPTLIYNFDPLLPTTFPEKNYILIYAYDNRIDDPDTINTIRKFALKENKSIICAGVYQNWCDKQILCSPFELLAYFKYADYIITDTFHGTVFSIKYNKNFATIIRNSNKEKLGYLLEKFNLVNRRLENINDLESTLKRTVDYTSVNELITRESINSIEYLQNNIYK